MHRLLTAALTVLAAGSPALAAAQDAGGVPPRYENGGFTLEVSGRLLLDYASQDITSDDPRVASGRFEDRYVRAARVGIEGDLGPRWFYEVEAGLRDEGEFNFEDVALGFRASEDVTVRLGNFRTFSLEALTSLNDVTFMSRGAYHDLIEAGRVSALEVSTTRGRWTASAAAISDSINNADDDEDPRGLVGRLVWAEAAESGDVLHLGLWGRAREGGGDAFRYRLRPNTAAGERYIDTRALFGSDRTVGLEAAVVRGPVSLQGEWARIEPERLSPGAPEGAAHGWYAFASWFPTGERRAYDEGSFDAPEILKPVGEGGVGALELALRRDEADVSDLAAPGAAGSRAGRYRAWTAGATWYLTDHLRFLANYTTSGNTAPGGQVDVETVQVRAQFHF